jgi:hypothetical protein
VAFVDEARGNRLSGELGSADRQIAGGRVDQTIFSAARQIEAKSRATGRVDQLGDGASSQPK